MFFNNFYRIQNEQANDFANLISSSPSAYAEIKGGELYPDIKGKVYFYKVNKGIVVYADIGNLPVRDDACANNIFAFHIHAGLDCGNNFEDADSHYNPTDCMHPAHAGDMPPLFGMMNGSAILVFMSDRFTIDEVIGRTVIIHLNRDDFTTQPSGDSGPMIACGEIKSN